MKIFVISGSPMGRKGAKWELGALVQSVQVTGRDRSPGADGDEGAMRLRAAFVPLLTPPHLLSPSCGEARPALVCCPLRPVWLPGLNVVFFLLSKTLSGESAALG